MNSSEHSLHIFDDKIGKEKNSTRFSGFADIYESARPSVPVYPIQRICEYLERAPETVIDIGCGTGLSTVIWKNRAAHVIGIEPNTDMLAIASRKASETVEFIQAFADSTGLADKCADVITASQSFHWMEPFSTLKEVDRLLKDDGIFATIDCDWPPVLLKNAEMAYKKLSDKVKRIEAENPEINNTFVRYSKDNHLKNISESGYFRYTRELLFANIESCTADRLINLILSQGSTQSILHRLPGTLDGDLRSFTDEIRSIYGNEQFDIEFSYRMRIGIKQAEIS